MSRNDNPEDLIISPMDTLLDTDFGALPVGPEGSFIPATAVYESDPIPEATEENMVCLRGPCRHYLEMRPFFAAGNAKGTLDHHHVLVKRTCMVISGYEVDMTDEVMNECTGWDPLMPEELALKNSRRERYYQIRGAKEETK